MKENTRKRKEFLRCFANGIVYGLVLVMCFLWVAGIGAQIYYGEVIEAFNSLLQLGLLFLVWELGRRLERMAELNMLLSELAQKYKCLASLIKTMSELNETKSNDEQDHEQQDNT